MSIARTVLPSLCHVCCFVALAALISPRLALFLLLIFTNRIQEAFEPWWLSVIGFFFLPWTTLAWALCYSPFLGVQGFGYIVVAFAFILDISTYAGSGRARQTRTA